MPTGEVIRIGEARDIGESWSAALGAFENRNQSRGLSPQTSNYYRYRIQAFTRFLEQHYPGTTPTDVDPQIVRGFLVDESGKSKTTAQHSYCALRALFGFLERDGFVDQNPMLKVDKPQRDRKVIPTFQLSDVDKMIETCGRDFIGARDRAMLALLVDTGARASELCGLRVTDIDWTEHSLLVDGKTGPRRIPFGSVAGQMLSQYLTRRPSELLHDYVFTSTLGARLDRHRLREIIRKRAAAAGIDGVRASPHTLRHSFAVSYIRAGGDAFSLQKCLGHTGLQMTRLYCELADSDIADKHAQFSPGDRLKAGQTGRKRIK